MNTRSIKTKISIGLLLTSILSLTLSSLALAEVNKDSYTIKPLKPNTISPYELIYQARPGDVIEDELFLRNLADVKLGFEVYATDGFINKDGHFAAKLKDDPREYVGKWAKVEKSPITLAPGESMIMPFKITIPEDAEHKRYEGAVLMQKGATPSDIPSFHIASRIALKVNLTVTDNPQEIPRTEWGTGQDNTFLTIYFWASLVLFISSLILLGFAYKKENGKKKKKTKKKK